jgi:hypothetical protein
VKELKRYLTSHGTMCNAADVAELEAINAELLEALETIRQDVLGYCICYDQPERERKAWAKADAAIAKSKERRHE